MSKLGSFLKARLGGSSTKTTSLATRSQEGGRNSFQGVFKVQELSKAETQELEDILSQYSKNDQDLGDDLKALSSITTEVKAITNQAVLLHGERIKKAQTLLKKYKDGAFSAWLLHSYGNRQTPYNLLQYYEFFQNLPNNLKAQVENMPRQAIYSLASREGEMKTKLALIPSFVGKTKTELLDIIRNEFPLPEGDRRRQTHSSLNQLKAILSALQSKGKKGLSKEERAQAKELVNEISLLLN